MATVTKQGARQRSLRGFLADSAYATLGLGAAAGADRCCAYAIPRGRTAERCTTGPLGALHGGVGLARGRSAVHDEGNGRVLGC